MPHILHSNSKVSFLCFACLAWPPALEANRGAGLLGLVWFATKTWCAVPMDVILPGSPGWKVRAVPSLADLGIPAVNRGFPGTWHNLEAQPKSVRRPTSPGLRLLVQLIIRGPRVRYLFLYAFRFCIFLHPIPPYRTCASPILPKDRHKPCSGCTSQLGTSPFFELIQKDLPISFYHLDIWGQELPPSSSKLFSLLPWLGLTLQSRPLVLLVHIL